MGAADLTVLRFTPDPGENESLRSVVSRAVLSAGAAAEQVVHDLAGALLGLLDGLALAQVGQRGLRLLADVAGAQVVECGPRALGRLAVPQVAQLAGGALPLLAVAEVLHLAGG